MDEMVKYLNTQSKTSHINLFKFINVPEDYWML